jgi:hypothetical protein
MRSNDLRHQNEANALSIENTDTSNQGILESTVMVYIGHNNCACELPFIYKL